MRRRTGVFYVVVVLVFFCVCVCCRFMHAQAARAERFPRPDENEPGYLVGLLPDPTRGFPAQRNDLMLVHEIHHLMHLTSYVVEFAVAVGPLTDRLTETRRRRSLKEFLGAGTSMLMFAPGWKRTPSWKPHGTGHAYDLAQPRINLHHNHRYQSYLAFLNQRALFYVPDPCLDAVDFPWDVSFRPLPCALHIENPEDDPDEAPTLTQSSSSESTVLVSP